MIRPPVLALLALFPLMALSLSAQELPIGTTARVPVSGDNPAVLTFEASEAGVLTVVARSDQLDLRLALEDASGQSLPGNDIDIDYRGNLGAEQGAMVIPHAGTYAVRIWTFSGSDQVMVAASWLPLPILAEAPIEHGSPDLAIRLSSGERHNDTLNISGGNPWSWYVVEVAQDGQLLFATRAPTGDLMIEVFQAGNFRESTARIDEDRDGVVGNETANVDVKAGDKVYFRVGSPLRSGGEIAYEVRTALVDL